MYIMFTCVCMWIKKKKKKESLARWLIFERKRQCRFYSYRAGAVALTSTTTRLARRRRRQWRKEDAEGDGVRHTKRSRVIQYAESKDREGIHRIQ